MSDNATGRGGIDRRHHRYIYKTGLCEGTRVMTLDGNLPVEYLAAGDRIVTRNGARTLRHVAVRPLKDCPVLVRRGALGPGRPACDLMLAPDQAVHLRSWQARVICGSDQVALPVGRLRDGRDILWGEHAGTLKVYDLELDRPEVIYAEGVEIMSAAIATPAGAVVAA